MKRCLCLFVLIVFLCGCSKSEDCLNRGMELRSKLLQSGCSFEAKITADYGDLIHTFTLQCTADPSGSISFTVSQPETICGITGTLSAHGGALTFADTALAFPVLADGELSPVSSPWIFINTLRSGYIRSAGDEGGDVRLTIDDSYEEDALQLDIWLDGQDLPKHVRILWQGRSILSMDVCNFTFV